MPRGSGVVLVGLDGRIVARLPRFASYPSSNTTRDGLMHNLDWAGILEQPRLVGPGDRYYRIDASHHALIPVPGQRVPLPGGAELVGHGSATEFRGLSVVRDGRVLVRRDMNLVVAAGTVVQSRGRLLDLRTGRSWRLPPHCSGRGAHGNVAYVLCETGPAAHYRGDGVETYPYTWLERLTRRGPVKVAEFSRDGPFPRNFAAVSPDGRFAASQGESTCDGGFVFVGPTAGSRVARIVSGHDRAKHPPRSTLLGWSADGRVVVQLVWGYCERPTKAGVYLVDPRTLKRTRVAREAWAMWNPYP